MQKRGPFNLKSVMRVYIPTYSILNTQTTRVIDTFKEGLSLVIKNFRKKKWFLGKP